MRRLSLGFGLTLLLGGFILLIGVQAQSEDGCPDGARCIYAGDFDSDIDGWLTNHADLEWLDSKTLGLNSAAQGVLHIYNLSPQPFGDQIDTGGIYKTFYLQPGVYHVIFRAGQDLSLIPNANQVTLRVTGTGYADGITAQGTLSAWYYSVLDSGLFEIHLPETVKVFVGPNMPSYIDYLYIERMADDSPTITPPGPTITPGGPTYTPWPTAVRTQATPVPTGTPVCDASTPTPTGIPAYATPTTPTPTPSSHLSRLETFDQSSSIDLSGVWSRLGGVHMDQANDHTGNGGMSALIAYDAHGDITTTATFTNALILSANFGYNTWVNAWAKADVVPVGQTAYLEIWERVSGTWYRQSAVAISPVYWYPAHAAIDSTATDIAFVVRRTDLPSVGLVNLDDVYLYAPESNAPSCYGGYPSDTTSMNGGELGTGDSSPIWWPADRPCPTLPDTPNNFWGPILRGLSIFMLETFAWAPIHPAGWMTSMAQNTLMSPIGVLFTFSAILFDWSVPITVLKLYLGWQGIYYTILIWRVIRYSTVQ